MPRTDDFGDVTIVGTAHVSPDSVAEVERVIEDRDPDVVAVELCGRRYDRPTRGHDLVDDDPQLHLRTLLLLPLMQHLQTRSADEQGLDRDVTDMGRAVSTASDVDADVALLDRDILRTFERFWDLISFKESLRVIASIGLALVRGESALLDIKTDETIDDDADIDEYLSTTAESYPTFRRVFVDERDVIMAQRLNHLQENGYDVVAVVGAAHQPGLVENLEEVKPRGDDVVLLNPAQSLERLD